MSGNRSGEREGLLALGATVGLGEALDAARASLPASAAV
jgi:hypothetical protein